MPVEDRRHSLTFTSKRRLRKSPRICGHYGSSGLHHMRSTVISLVSSFSLDFIKGGRILSSLMLITHACFRQWDCMVCHKIKADCGKLGSYDAGSNILMDVKRFWYYFCDYFLFVSIHNYCKFDIVKFKKISIRKIEFMSVSIQLHILAVGGLNIPVRQHQTTEDGPT